MLIGAFLILIYFFSFRFVVLQILDRGDSDTNNIIALIEDRDSVEKGITDFSKNRNLEIIAVDNKYQVIHSSASTLRTQYFSNNITFAKSEGLAYSFVKKDVGKSFSIIYSKRSLYKNDVIVISVEYPFLLYSDFKKIIISLIVLAILLIAIDTCLISSLYINTYINDLNDYLKNRHLFNEFDEIENSSLFENNSGEIINLLNTLNKFRKRYESILENNKERFSKITSLLTIIPSGLLIIDKNKQISLMNDMVSNLLEIKKREILNPIDVDNLQVVYELWEKVINNKKIKVQDIKIKNKILEVEAIPLKDKYAPFEFIGVLFLIRDVTKSRELSNMKDEFVSNVSHELRTPITIISGFSQALLNENISDEDKLISINSINEEAKKMTKLIEELLQISRIDKDITIDDKQFFDPFDIVKEQVSLFVNKALEKDIKIQVEVEKPQECKLNCNLIYFRQILNNLLDNAIKYSTSKTLIAINEYIDNDNYYFSITDQGVGIAQDDIKQIFERFYRVEKSRNSDIAGSGLGLSIVKQFLDSIGGKIKVESEIGVGTNIVVIIKREKND